MMAEVLYDGGEIIKVEDDDLRMREECCVLKLRKDVDGNWNQNNRIYSLRKAATDPALQKRRRPSDTSGISTLSP